MYHPPARRRSSQRHAFTLMEVLLVLAILVILGSLAGVMISNAQKRANVDSTKAQIAAFEQVLDSFKIANGVYPGSLQDLRQNPGNMPRWDGPYMDKDVNADAWGQPYRYQVGGNGETYSLSSAGPDGVDGTADDIGHSQ